VFHNRLPGALARVGEEHRDMLEIIVIVVVVGFAIAWLTGGDN